MRLVLDSEAMSALAGPNSAAKRQVRRNMEAAARSSCPVVVPTVVLAELYRAPSRNALIDSCLSRERGGVQLRDTDRHMARLVGRVLSEAHAGSELLVDAHVVATAVEGGGGVVVTGDPRDLRRLGAAFRSVTVEAI